MVSQTSSFCVTAAVGCFALTFHKQGTIKYKVVLHQDKSQGSYSPESIQFLKTCRPLHSTRLVFLPLLTPWWLNLRFLSHHHLWTIWQDVLSEYSIQTRSCGGNTAFGWKIRCSENRARRSPSSEPQFPLQCIEGLWLGMSQGLSTSAFQQPLLPLRPRAPRRLQQGFSWGPNPPSGTEPLPTSRRHLYLSR